MQSQGRVSQTNYQERIRQNAITKWESLSDSQKSYAKKAWGIITYKWRWQIAMNIPYLLIFTLDRTVPAIHRFDIKLLTSVSSNLHLKEILASWNNLI